MKDNQTFYSGSRWFEFRHRDFQNPYVNSGASIWQDSRKQSFSGFIILLVEYSLVRISRKNRYIYSALFLNLVFEVFGYVQFEAQLVTHNFIHFSVNSVAFVTLIRENMRN